MARLGYDPFFTWAQTTILVTVDWTGRGYQGLVEVLDEHSAVLGRRTLAAKTDECAEMTRSMSLAVSVALDDMNLGAAPPAPVVTPTESAPPPNVGETSATLPRPGAAADGLPPERAPDKSPARVPRERIVVSASVGPIASVGVAPAPSFGAALALRARRRWLSLEVEGRADVPASGNYLNGSITTNVIGGSILLCGHPAAELYACGLGFLANFAEHGSVPPVLSQTALFAALGIRVGYEFSLGQYVFIDFHADALGALTRHRVELDDHPVFEVFPVNATVGVAVGARY
jgi:hypothetical protein